VIGVPPTGNGELVCAVVALKVGQRVEFEPVRYFANLQLGPACADNQSSRARTKEPGPQGEAPKLFEHPHPYRLSRLFFRIPRVGEILTWLKINAPFCLWQPTHFRLIGLPQLRKYSIQQTFSWAPS
jgi:hypothetical protein